MGPSTRHPLQTRHPLHPLLPSIALLLALTSLPPAAAAARQATPPEQGASLEYVEVTRIEASGVVGAMLSRAGGGEHRRGVHVLGTRMRSDDGSSSLIFDAASREWIFLDHDARTYLTISLAEMQELSAEALAVVREGRAEMEELRAQRDAESAEARAEMEAAMAEAEAAMTLSVQHVASGRRDVIGGFDSEHHQIVLTLDEADGIQGAEEVEGGSLVIVLDLWLSEALARADPLYWDGTRGSNAFHDALMEDPFLRELADELAASVEGEGAVDFSSFAMLDPRVGVALNDAMESLSAMEGTPVTTRTVVAVLPSGVELDTELLLAWEPGTMGSQIQGAASEAAREQMREAGRDAVRGLTRGLLGRGGGGEPEIDEEALVIRPLFRITTEVLDVAAGGPPAPERFEVPAGYQALSAPAPVGAGTRR